MNINAVPPVLPQLSNYPSDVDSAWSGAPGGGALHLPVLHFLFFLLLALRVVDLCFHRQQKMTLDFSSPALTLWVVGACLGLMMNFILWSD